MFANDQVYHVFNRGIDKQKIFYDEQDYQRFVDNLFLLNNKDGKIRTTRNFFDTPKIKREKLVEILRWSLLPNHYHLLLYEIEDGGAVEFMKRIGNAYTKYFNTKNKGRSGYLFQNSAKKVLVENNSQFLYIPFYIDLNPLDLKFQNWKETGLKDNKKAIDFLKNYEWSSFKDIFGNGNRQGIINQELFYDMYGINPDEYEKELLKFLKNPDINL